MPNLSSKLSEYRDKEVEGRSRAAAIATIAEERELNTDELSELKEIETRLEEIGKQSAAIERTLKIGSFSDRVNEPVGLDENDQNNFSILKLMRSMDPKASPSDRDSAGLELEASREIEMRIGKSPRGAYLPMEIVGEWNPNTRNRGMQRRDLTSDSFASAGAFIGVDFRPDQLIPLLRNKMAVAGAGATFIDGLVGDVAIPKHTGAATAGWISSDGGTLSESTQTAGQVTLSPRTVGTFTDYSRQFNLQTSVSAEQFVRDDLSTVVAIEKDRAALHGSGSNGEPTGIENVTGIGAQTFATASTPTRAEVIGMRSDLATANALVANLAFITNSTVYGNMLDTAIDSGSGRFLLDENGLMLGRPVIESNQVQAGEMYFGNWSDLVIGTWGGMDLMIDPYTGATAGNVRVLIFHSCDIAARHAESFCRGSA